MGPSKPRSVAGGLGLCAAIIIATLMLAGCGATETASEDSAAGSRPVSPTTPPDVVTGDRVAPSTPASLSALAVSPTRVDLNWSASTDNEAVVAYRVFRNGALLTTLGDVTSYQDSTVVAGTLYSYTVQALDEAGNASGTSPAAIVTTPSVPDTIAPTVPTGLTATPVSHIQINLSWNAATDNVAVTGYRINRNGSLLANLGNVTTYRDRFLTPSTTYVYTIQALDAAGNVSGLSPAVGATTLTAPDTIPPTTPTDLTASAIAPTLVDLEWTASTDNVVVASYRVYRNGGLLATVADTEGNQFNLMQRDPEA